MAEAQQKSHNLAVVMQGRNRQWPARSIAKEKMKNELLKKADELCAMGKIN